MIIASALQNILEAVSRVLSGDAVLDELGVTPAQKTIIVRSAQEYDSKGIWISFDTLAYEAAERNEKWDQWAPHTLPRFLGGAWDGEAVTLTALGLLAAGSAPRTAEKLTQLARICAKRKLDLRDDAKIGRDLLVAEYGWSLDDATKAGQLFGMLPGLTGGGAGGDAWNMAIHRGALEYRNVEAPADLLDVLMGFAEQDRALFNLHRAPGTTMVEGPPAPSRWRHWMQRSEGALERPWLKYVIVPVAVAVVAGVILLVIHP
jgi:hypothetical protein